MDLEPYLRATPALDFDHPAVRAFAAGAAAGAADARGQAVRLFLEVRDRIRYDPYRISFEPGHFSASATLERGYGFCVTKSILYAAGLRALGIPSRLGFADVVNHLATARLKELMRTDVFAWHGYAEAWLGGKWVKATPAFNASLCEKFGAPPLEFDGVHDAVLQATTRGGARFMEYVRDRGTWADFSLEAMLEGWRECYPHFFLEGGAPAQGDFDAEAERERR